MLLLKKDTFALESPSRLVKADEAAAVASVDAVMEAARKEGYEKGIAAGKMEMSIQQLDLLESSVKFMESVEDKMVGVVLKALRKCVDEIGDEELVVGVVRKAMKAIVRNQQQITLKVNPGMVEAVKARTAEILKEYPTLGYIDVVEDERMDDRSCVVETAAGMVDASIEAQFGAIERSLRKSFGREG